MKPVAIEGITTRGGLTVFAREEASEVEGAVGGDLDATQLAALRAGMIVPMVDNPVRVVKAIAEALEGYEDDAFRARFPRKDYGP